MLTNQQKKAVAYILFTVTVLYNMQIGVYAASLSLPKKLFGFFSNDQQTKPEVLGVTKNAIISPTPVSAPTAELSSSEGLMAELRGIQAKVVQLESSLVAPIITDVDTTEVNLIQNSSFESNVGANPKQWTRTLDSSISNPIVTEEAPHTGKYGLKFKGEGNGYFGVSQPQIQLIENRAYTYTTFVKVTNVPIDTTLKLSLWDQEGNKYADSKSFSFNGTKDWSEVQFTFDNRNTYKGKKWYPMIEVLGLKSGNLYIDDLGLTEGTVKVPYHFNAGGGLQEVASFLGDGTVTIGTDGSLYPTLDKVGNLGKKDTNKWNELYLAKATIDKEGNLVLGGSAVINSGVKINGAYVVNLPDNSPNALDIQQDGNSYMNINTTNGSEAIVLGSGTSSTTISSILYSISPAASITLSPNTNVTSLTISPSVAQTTAIDVTDSDIITALSVGANDITGTTGTVSYSNWNIAANGDITTAGDINVNGDNINSDGTLVINGATGLQLTTTAGDLLLNSAGNTDIRDNIVNGAGDVTIADILTQTGSGNQVTFGGNVDATNGVDVTGAALTFAVGLSGDNFTVADTTGDVHTGGTLDVDSTTTLGGNVTFDTGADRIITVATAADNSAISLKVIGPPSSGAGTAGGDLVLGGGAPGAGGTRGAVIPNSTDNLGKSTNRWGSVFANTVNFLTSLVGAAGTPSVDFSNVTAGNFSIGADAITDAMVSNTLTSSLFVGSGSTTTAVDLGTTEVAGTLTTDKGGTGTGGTYTQYGVVYAPTTTSMGTTLVPASSNVLLHGNASGAPTWSAVNLASADVTGVLPDANVADTLTFSTLTGSNGNTITNPSAGTLVLSATTIETAANATIQPTAAGTLSLRSNGASNIDMDAGGLAAVNIGATNTNAVNIGRATVTTTINGSIAITGGTINGTTIGGTTTAAGTFTTLTGDKGVYTLDSQVTLGDTFTLTPNKSYMRLGGAAARTSHATTAISDGTDGQILVLVGTDDANNITIKNAANTRIGADKVLGAGDTLTLIWDNTDSNWELINFSNN